MGFFGGGKSEIPVSRIRVRNFEFGARSKIPIVKSREWIPRSIFFLDFSEARRLAPKSSLFKFSRRTSFDLRDFRHFPGIRVFIPVIRDLSGLGIVFPGMRDLFVIPGFLSRDFRKILEIYEKITGIRDWDYLILGSS